jgi:hypothetical protein
MASPEVLDSLSELPPGSHALAFHASRREAAEHAASFLEGTPRGQSAKYWVADDRLAAYYASVAAERCPEHVGCVAALPTEQVEPREGKLRPVSEVRQFVGEHPDGVTAAADTISRYWGPSTMDAHLEYEAWFDRLPRENSRFLCPYDLRTVPAELAPEVMRELGSHHSHVVLSDADDPGARLLELFIFESAHELPDSLRPTLDWAVRSGLVVVTPGRGSLTLTPHGVGVVRDWGEHCTIDW